jgi:hypothetical protein
MTLGRPFLHQVQLRTQKVFAEGMTAANWPPYLRVLPENAEEHEENLGILKSVREIPVERQNAIWQKYISNHDCRQNQDLLFEMVTGNWGNARVKEFVNELRLEMQPTVLVIAHR